MTRATILALALAGCAAPQGGNEGKAEAPAPDGRDAEVRQYLEIVEAQFRAPGVAAARLGETARLGDLQVRPLRVTEESRCPQDVECVWAGRLKLAVAISGVPGEAELTLREPYTLPAGRGTLTLAAAAPAPWRDPPPGIERGPAVRFAFRRD